MVKSIFFGLIMTALSLTSVSTVAFKARHDSSVDPYPKGISVNPVGGYYIDVKLVVAAEDQKRGRSKIKSADPQTNVERVQRLLTEKSWNYLFPQHLEQFGYQGFLRSVAKFSGLCSDQETKLRSDQLCAQALAVLFTHFAQQTGQQDPYSDVEPWRQGLSSWTELDCFDQHSDCELSVAKSFGPLLSLLSLAAEQGVTTELGGVIQVLSEGEICKSQLGQQYALRHVSFYQMFAAYLQVPVVDEQLLGCEGWADVETTNLAKLKLYWDEDASWQQQRPAGQSFECQLVGYKTPYFALQAKSYQRCVETEFDAKVIP